MRFDSRPRPPPSFPARKIDKYKNHHFHHFLLTFALFKQNPVHIERLDVAVIADIGEFRIRHADFFALVVVANILADSFQYVPSSP